MKEERVREMMELVRGQRVHVEVFGPLESVGE
jgi:hypothetical protein